MIRLASFLLILFVVPSPPLKAQNKGHGIFADTTRVAWLGMDFTRANFLNLGMSKTDIKKEYIPRWNGLMGLEWDKFDIESYFGYDDVSLCFERSLDRNREVHADSIIRYSRRGMDRLSKDELEGVVSGYEGASDPSLGLLFIVESFGKFGEQDLGYIWVTFLDIRKGKLLMSERIRGNAGGRGKVNYWINVAFEVLEKAPAKMGFR